MRRADRRARPGAIFAALELIGVPRRVTFGDRGLKEGQGEYQHRSDAASTQVDVVDVFNFLKGQLTP